MTPEALALIAACGGDIRAADWVSIEAARRPSTLQHATGDRRLAERRGPVATERAA